MLESIKNILGYYYHRIIPAPIHQGAEFSGRIKKRHKVFWSPLNAERIRNTAMNAMDPLSKWKNVKYWQRKLSNKFNSREFAKKHNCRVPELYWKGRNVKSIDFSRIPENYVIRPTTGYSSGSVFLMHDGVNQMDGKTYSNEDIRQILARSLSENQKLEFLIEEFLRTEEGVYKIPDDYKFYMFNGEVACIQVINRLGPSKGFTTCYNEDWEMIENVNDYYPEGKYQPRPVCYQEMVEKAKELSRSYEIFVRIDLYATDNGAVFGEFTPTPFKGYCYTPFGEKLLSNYWDKSCKGRV